MKEHAKNVLTELSHHRDEQAKKLFDHLVECELGELGTQTIAVG